MDEDPKARLIAAIHDLESVLPVARKYEIPVHNIVSRIAAMVVQLDEICAAVDERERGE